MSEIRIASRYAKSLIELANEQGVLEAVFADIQLFADTCKHSQDLRVMLKSPIIRGSKKLHVIETAFTGFNALTRLFFKTVISKGREAFLQLISIELIRMYNDQHNIVSAKVTTASVLSANLLADIQRTLEEKTGKNIILETDVDPGLIAGIVVRIGDSLFDASIARKLKIIKKELVLN